LKTVILCGGSGTRLWPLSTTESPKQFVQIFNGKSLFEKTIERNNSDKYSIILNEKQLPLAKTQIAENCFFITEEVGRNTAPAIAFAALSSDPEEVLLVLPSDHLIENIEEYKKCIELAEQYAKEDKLVTFGIKPTYPETGYGYIQAKEHDVLSFKEKPDLETAKKYLADGEYYWNSGMFCFKAKTFLEELQKYSPQIYDACKTVYEEKKSDNNTLTLPADKLNRIPSLSIDYAVMEHSEKIKVVPSDINWKDLGSFDSLDTVLDKDENGNTQNERLIVHESKNNLIIKQLDKDIALFNVEDLIIVQSEGSILIGKKGKSQNVKKVFELRKTK
jgi:mannose-1-phosphate guanylyltransferase